MRSPSPVAVGVGLSTIAMYAISAVGVSSPASAAPPTAAKAGASAEILHLSALTLPGDTTLADVGVGPATGRVDGTASPRTSASAANLDAALAGRAVAEILAAAQQSAPPTT